LFFNRLRKRVTRWLFLPFRVASVRAILKKETLKNIQEAIRGWIEVSRKYGDRIAPI
jgi:hypothetical protein